jgi:hypothetical protein
MANATTQPIRLTNFMVYNSSKQVLGVATATLPSIEAQTDTITGAGIAGEIDMPTLGHYGSITVSLSFRSLTAEAVELAKCKSHELELRGSLQVHDSSSGEMRTIPARLALRSIPKSYNLGSFEPASGTDSELEMEVVYLKYVLDGEEKIEIDKLNFIAKFNGDDLLASVRSDLGL